MDLIKNRAVAYGDAVFETIKIVNNKILFFEDHYFRLMASMRILRMRIPLTFTQEFLEQQIIEQIALKNVNSARVKLLVYRKSGGYYLPNTNEVDYLIEVNPLELEKYQLNDGKYEVEIFKDFFITSHLLSTLKTTNRLINILGSIYADENDYENCVLINQDKNIVEALNGNIFLVFGKEIQTPPLSDGALNGIMRKQIIKWINQQSEYTFIEKSISPFVLQSADEIFISNVIQGVVTITKYRKKDYENLVAEKIIKYLNSLL